MSRPPNTNNGESGLKRFMRPNDSNIAAQANAAGVSDNPDVVSFLQNKGARSTNDVSKVLGIINDKKRKPQGSLITGGNSLLGQ
jgi:hypothetical protein